MALTAQMEGGGFDVVLSLSLIIKSILFAAHVQQLRLGGVWVYICLFKEDFSSLIDVFSRLYVPGLPSSHPRASQLHRRTLIM